MAFGETLRKAREAAGLSTTGLAHSTHLLVQVVEGLENEDFRRIPAPIYGRGFVKLYCEYVGLDPKPLQEEFMRLYKGGPAAAKPKLAPAAAPEPVLEPALEEPVAEAPAAEPEAIFPAAEPEEKPEAPAVEEANDIFAPQPEAARPERRSYGELFEQAYSEEGSGKQSAAEKFHATLSAVSHGVFTKVKKLPPNTARIAIAIAAAVVVLILVAWGVSALYSATAHPAAPVAPAENAPEKAKTVQAAPAPEKAKTGKDKPAAKTPAKKTGGLKQSGMEVPPLYIN